MTEKRHSPLSRRNTLIAGGVGLGMLAGLRSHAGLAHEPDVPEVVQAFLDGWVALDADQIAQTYAVEGHREDITSPVIFQGRDEIHRSLLEFFGAFENASVVHPEILAGPEQFAADTWEFTGDYVGELPGLPSGGGQSVTIKGFTLIELVNGEIQRTVDYYDVTSILVQLGAQPQATPTDG